MAIKLKIKPRPHFSEEILNGGFTLKTHERYSKTLRRRKLKTRQSLLILDLWLRTTRAGKTNDYLGFIVYEKVRFQFNNVVRPRESVKPAFSNAFGLKSVFEKLRFRDGLVWTVGLTVEIKLCFSDGLMWTVGLTVEIKLRFSDGLVWTVGLTVEIKLRFRDGLVWTLGLTVQVKLRLHIPPA